ncbi:MAG UNVERIFIED_CONTAM: hypothetical protein LVR18_34375 [Planctomycetaceae bacterium]
MDLRVATAQVTRADIATLNDQLPAEARVLMVGEAEVFDAEFSLLYNTVFDDSLFEELAAVPDGQPPGSRRPLRPATEFLANCRRRQITHILVNWSEILRYRLPGSYGYSEFVQPGCFEELVRQRVLLPPRELIVRNWSELTSSEQQEVLSWEDGIRLIKNNQFPCVQLYEMP